MGEEDSGHSMREFTILLDEEQDMDLLDYLETQEHPERSSALSGESWSDRAIKLPTFLNQPRGVEWALFHARQPN